MLLSTALPCLADDWPQWRGTNRDAVWRETGLPDKFPPDGLKVQWRAQIGPGHATPVVAAGRVFVTDSEKAKPRAWERVHCFDEHTGAQLWLYSDEVTLAESWFNPDNKNGPIPTPLVSDGKLVALGSTGHVICLDVIHGNLLWKRDLGEDLALKGFAELTPCPLVEDGMVIVVTGGKPGACVIALDLMTGKEVWRALDDPYTFSTPAIITAGGKKQFILWTKLAVTSLDVANGKTLWREELATREDYAVATPVAEGTRLLISGLMFRLDSAKPAATVLWPPEAKPLAKRVLSHMCTPLILSDAVYSMKMSGHLLCLDAQTGEQLWESAAPTKPKYGATVHLTDNGDSVLLFTDEGNLIRARLTRNGYEELSRAHLIDPDYKFGGSTVVWAPPSFADQRVFARNHEEVVCASLVDAPQ